MCNPIVIETYDYDVSGIVVLRMGKEVIWVKPITLLTKRLNFSPKCVVPTYNVLRIIAFPSGQHS